MRRFLLTAVVALLTPLPLAAQSFATPTPDELHDAWPRFAEAWRRADLASLSAMITPDFTLIVPADAFVGTAALEADWPRARVLVGPILLPVRFVRYGDRIVETGRAQLLAEADGAHAEDDLLCAPDAAGSHTQPAAYVREWARSAGGSWRARSLVLQ